MSGCSTAVGPDIPWASLGPVIAIFFLWIFGLVVYAVRAAVKGRVESRRVSQMGGTRLLNAWTMEYGYWVIKGIGRWFIKMGISPNMLTALSLVLAVISAVALYFGRFGIGGWLMIAAAMFDAFDGMVARATGVASEAGEYFDSVVDRYCELFGFIAFMGYYFPQHPWLALVAGLAMVASIMITFNRAKGEAQGITGVPSGLMRRHERLIYIGVGSAFSPIAALWLEPGATRPVFHVAVLALGIVAFFGNITAIRLGLEIHRRLQAAEEKGPDEAGESADPGASPARVATETPFTSEK